MNYALISDIHANLPALEAVLADIERRSEVAAPYPLGDLVGYAPWANETVELIRQRRSAPVGRTQWNAATSHLGGMPETS